MIVPNPTKNPTPSLYDLSNNTIGTNLEKKKKRIKKDKKKDEKKDDKEEEEEEEELIFGWAKVLLSFEQFLYAALDARLGFEIARRHWKLHKATIAMLIVSIFRWMIVDVWCGVVCESSRFFVPLIVILLDE
jgi:hypothetical protein